MEMNKQKHLKKRMFTWGALVVSTVVLLLFDLWLKYWAAFTMPGQPTQEVIPGILGLTYTINTGAAFGIFGNFAWGRWGLTAVKIVLMAGLLWYYHRLPLKASSWLVRVPLMLILAGGLGNLYDRVTLGYVRDMLAFSFVNFPIFNLADVYIVIGCFTSAFVILFIAKDIP